MRQYPVIVANIYIFVFLSVRLLIECFSNVSGVVRRVVEVHLNTSTGCQDTLTMKRLPVSVKIEKQAGISFNYFSHINKHHFDGL
jgi:hypothetical protein